MKPTGGLNSFSSGAVSVVADWEADVTVLDWSAAGVSSPDAGACANAEAAVRQSANALVSFDIATPLRSLPAQLVLQDSTFAHTLRDWSKFAWSCSRLAVMARSCSSLKQRSCEKRVPLSMVFLQ